MWEEIFSQTETLARDLNKENPRTTFVGPNIDLSDQDITLLKNIFTHLIRNSMDHGLETADVRISSGKDPIGTLHLTIEPNSDGLHLRFSDDGGGLKLTKLKEVGVGKGLILDTVNNPKTISELIFDSGFSTASAVTEISGRGVGMDAVKSFIEQAGGKLEINFLEDPPEQPTESGVSFEFVIFIPLLYPEFNAVNG